MTSMYDGPHYTWCCLHSSSLFCSAITWTPAKMWRSLCFTAITTKPRQPLCWGLVWSFFLTLPRIHQGVNVCQPLCGHDPACSWYSLKTRSMATVRPLSTSASIRITSMRIGPSARWGGPEGFSPKKSREKKSLLKLMTPFLLSKEADEELLKSSARQTK